MSNMGPWMGKSLGISAAIALLAGLGFYIFFRIHQELYIAPNYAWRLAAIVFLISAISTLIYFRVRTDR